MAVLRNMISDILFLKNKYPVLAITGPRQSGKTTFLRKQFPEYRYVSMEDKFLQDFLERDPYGFFEKYSQYVIFDEAQNAPLLFSYMQTIVDQMQIMGQFILSGSQNFHLISNITQSLAGRVALFNMFPFDFIELKSANLLNKDCINCMIKGFYPAIFDRNIPYSVFYRNYLKTYVERDITDLVNIRDLRSFRNFISLLASRAGQLLNLNSLANDCGITQPTAKSWLTLLETSFIVFLLHPYYNNFDKRIIKTPKIYFYDTGLLCHLLKIKDTEATKYASYKGNIFENMIISEFIKQNAHFSKDREFWFWRDSNGHEIDLIMSDENGNHIFEIKSSITTTEKLFEGLNKFKSFANDDVATSNLIYAGDEEYKRSGHQVISWSNIF